MKDICDQKIEHTSILYTDSAISRTAKKILNKMMRKLPGKRPNAAELLENKWFKNVKPYVEDTKLLNTFRNIGSYRHTNSFQKVVLNYIATQIKSQASMDRLRSVFISLDYGNTGILSRQDFREAFRRLNIQSVNQLELDEFFDTIDIDGNGQVEYSEFITAFMDWKDKITERELKQTFDAFDLNGDGRIEISELREIFKFQQEYKEDFVMQYMQNADLDQDGYINFDEFKLSIKYFQQEYGLNSPELYEYQEILKSPEQHLDIDLNSSKSSVDSILVLSESSLFNKEYPYLFIPSDPAIPDRLSHITLQSLLESVFPITESNLCFIMFQLISSLKYLKISSLIHRAINLKSIYLYNPAKMSINLLHPKYCMNTTLSDLNVLSKSEDELFSAPEVILTNNYSQYSDIWSCGVVMYILISKP